MKNPVTHNKFTESCIIDYVIENRKLSYQGCHLKSHEVMFEFIMSKEAVKDAAGTGVLEFHCLGLISVSSFVY